ncbi:MAG: hypothetical protein ACPGXY_04545 [Alphaproteobacteria bacterium]
MLKKYFMSLGLVLGLLCSEGAIAAGGGGNDGEFRELPTRQRYFVAATAPISAYWMIQQPKRTIPKLFFLMGLSQWLPQKQRRVIYSFIKWMFEVKYLFGRSDS